MDEQPLPSPSQARNDRDLDAVVLAVRLGGMSLPQLTLLAGIPAERISSLLAGRALACPVDPHALDDLATLSRLVSGPAVSRYAAAVSAGRPDRVATAPVTGVRPHPAGLVLTRAITDRAHGLGTWLAHN